MLKLIEFEAVNYRHWLVTEEFVSMIGVSFLFPGLTAVKLAALIGYKQAGMAGLLLSIISLNLPGLVLTIIGYRLLGSHTGPMTHKLMIAVQYGALALLAAASFSVAKGVMGAYFSWPIALISGLFFLSLIGWEVSPFWGFLAFIGVCVFLVR